VIIRAGLPKTTGFFPGALLDIDTPGLVSANGMWDQRARKFRLPGFAVCDLDLALDSAGFVVMTKWGGQYPWSIPQYVELAGMHGWSWWASMDFCCEPGVAKDDVEIRRRVMDTALYLTAIDFQVKLWRDVGIHWLQPPMPVLQGWKPKHYLESLALTHNSRGVLPTLLGLGSVCGRHLRGPDGFEAILSALDKELPAGVQLHLFGVKGAILREFRDHPRVGSMDSIAWDFRARRLVNEKRAEQADALGWRPTKHDPEWISCSNALRAEAMKHWVSQQTRSTDPLKESS
jgi:hypothetical protein